MTNVRIVTFVVVALLFVSFGACRRLDGGKVSGTSIEGGKPSGTDMEPREMKGREQMKH